MVTIFAENTASTGNLLLTFVPLVLIFVFFYLLILRPQKKQERKTRRKIRRLRTRNKTVAARM